MSNNNIDKLLRINSRTRNNESPSYWRRISLQIANNAPKEEGVYVLYHDGNVVYVGQTKNFRSRFAQHKSNLLLFKNRHFFPMERFYFKYRTCLNRKEREQKLIERLQPFWNVNLNPNPFYKKHPAYHIVTPLRMC